MLGASTVCGQRQNTQLERTRLVTALARQVMLRTAWLTWPRFVRAPRTWCVSKAAYGWIGRLPTLTDADKVFAAAAVASATCRMANKHLRAATYGAILYLDCVVPSGLLSKLTKLLAMERQRLVPAGDRTWTAKPGSTVHIFKKWMSKRGWLVAQPWIWTSALVPTYRLDLSARSRQTPEERGHVLRQNWRLFQLKLFLSGNRHEAQHSVQRLLRFADEINFEELREFLMASAPFRTVMLGAMLSPAWYAVCTDSPNTIAASDVGNTRLTLLTWSISARPLSPVLSDLKTPGNIAWAGL